MNKLSKTEKEMIAGLYKCRRAAEEQEISEQIHRDMLNEVKDIDARLKQLRQEISDGEVLRDQIIKDKGYGSLDRMGCCKTHPKIDEFKRETNDQLMKLWAGEITIL